MEAQQFELLLSMFRTPTGGFAQYMHTIEEEPVLPGHLPLVQLYTSNQLREERGIDQEFLQSVLPLMSVLGPRLAKLAQDSATNGEAWEKLKRGIEAEQKALIRQWKSLRNLCQTLDNHVNQKQKCMQFVELAYLSEQHREWEVEMGKFAEKLQQSMHQHLGPEVRTVIRNLCELPHRLAAISEQTFAEFWDTFDGLMLFAADDLQQEQVKRFVHMMEAIAAVQTNQSTSNFITRLWYCLQQENAMRKERSLRSVQNAAGKTSSSHCLNACFPMLDRAGFKLSDTFGDLLLLELLCGDTEISNKESSTADGNSSYLLRRLNCYIHEHSMRNLCSPMAEQHFVTLLHNTLNVLAGCLYFLLIQLAFCLESTPENMKNWKDSETETDSETLIPERTYQQMAGMCSWHAQYLRYFLALLRLAEIVEMPCSDPLAGLIKFSMHLFPKLTENETDSDLVLCFQDSHEFKMDTFANFCSWTGKRSALQGYIRTDCCWEDEIKKGAESVVFGRTCPLTTHYGTVKSDIVFPLPRPNLRIPHYLTAEEKQQAEFGETEAEASYLLNLQKEIQLLSQEQPFQTTFFSLQLKNDSLDPNPVERKVALSQDFNPTQDHESAVSDTSEEVFEIAEQEGEASEEEDSAVQGLDTQRSTKVEAEMLPEELGTVHSEKTNTVDQGIISLEFPSTEIQLDEEAWPDLTD